MAQNTNTTIDTPLRAFLNSEKLTTQIFPSWFHRLRHVLRSERKLYVLFVSLPQEPPLTSIEAHNAWLKHNDDSINVSRLMLETMVPSLQERMETFPLRAFDMVNRLREYYQIYMVRERFDTIGVLHRTKMEEDQDVSSHIHKMRTHLVYLDRLGYPYSNGKAVDVILKSLTKAFDVFVENLNIDLEKISVPELHTMLETFERNLPMVTVTCGRCGNFGHGGRDCPL